MAEPLRCTYEAMPHPKVVIAVGTDAVGGGITGPSYATAGGIGDIVPVDVLAAGIAAQPVQHPARAAAGAGTAARAGR